MDDMKNLENNPEMKAKYDEFIANHGVFLKFSKIKKNSQKLKLIEENQNIQYHGNVKYVIKNVFHQMMKVDVYVDID